MEKTDCCEMLLSERRRRQPLGENLLMELGARVSGYHCQKSFYRVIPHLKFNYDLSQSAKLNLNLGIRNQYLFQTGFSSAFVVGVMIGCSKR